MPEVFILCEYPTLNGGEWSMLAVLGYVQASGFTPVVLAPPEGPLADKLAAGNVEMLPFRFHSSDGIRLSRDILHEQLERTITRRRPALLHANSLSMGRLSGPVVERLRLPSIAHLRDIIKLSARAIADLNRHTRILAVSNATREYHIAGGVAADKIHVLYNGVDLDEFRPGKPTGYLHRELGLPADAKLIGTIGQIGLRKGQDILLHAATTSATRTGTGPFFGGKRFFADGRRTENMDLSPLPAGSFNIHYLIIGERNSEKEESRRFESDLHHVADGRLAGRVHFLGRRNDIPSLLRELTLLVHPARQEPLGRVLLEAAASGVPVVATNVGGTAEIFPTRDHAALLVPPDDSDTLAAAIVELIEDGRLRNSLADAARQRMETHFSAQTAADNLIQHYNAVAES